MQKKIKTVINNSVVMLLATLLVGSALFSPIARADQFDDKINQIQADSSAKQATANQLQAQADTYQGEIDRLQTQINVIRQQIVDSENKRDNLQNQIVQAQADLDKQKALLGENIKTMYVEGEISTLEMLASSKDLSEFLDKQQYHTSVQQNIKTSLDKINTLKAQLKAQKEEVEKLLVDQQAMNQQVTSAQAQQSSLLAYTQDQKNQYTAQISANRNSIAELRRQQIIANARFSGGAPGTGPTCGGGYPAKWCQIAQDTVFDDWGMYNRECVSYTAFKVAAAGRYMPYWGGYGNANQWDDNAGSSSSRRAGITMDGNPVEGDVAQTDRGSYGHVMYVEFVYGDGTILISQYNVNLDGRYSEKRISASGLNFIHFPKSQ